MPAHQISRKISFACFKRFSDLLDLYHKNLNLMGSPVHHPIIALFSFYYWEYWISFWRCYLILYFYQRIIISRLLDTYMQKCQNPHIFAYILSKERLCQMSGEIGISTFLMVTVMTVTEDHVFQSCWISCLTWLILFLTWPIIS